MYLRRIYSRQPLREIIGVKRPGIVFGAKCWSMAEVVMNGASLKTSSAVHLTLVVSLRVLAFKALTSRELCRYSTIYEINAYLIVDKKQTEKEKLGCLGIILYMYRMVPPQLPCCTAVDRTFLYVQGCSLPSLCWGVHRQESAFFSQAPLSLSILLH